MKRRLLLLTSIICITVFGLPVMAEVEINYADLNPYASYGGNFAACPVAEVTNTGEKPIRLQDICFNVEDSENRLMKTIDMCSCVPCVLSPGESGYLFKQNTQVSDIANPFDCHVVPQFSEQEYAEENYRCELSDVAMNILNGDKYEVVGRATNTSGSTIYSVQPYTIWFDTNKRCIGVSVARRLSEMQPNEQQAFTIEARTAFMEDQTKIATYKIIVEEIPRVVITPPPVHIPYSETVNAE